MSDVFEMGASVVPTDDVSSGADVVVGCVSHCFLRFI
jgi:hypothetical protein